MQPFSNPPEVADKLLQPPEKRKPPPIKTHKNKGINVSPFTPEVSTVTKQDKYTNLVIFSVFFLSLLAQPFLISSEQNFYYSRGIANFDSFFNKIPDKTKVFIKILFATFISFIFYNISSLFQPLSIISSGLLTISLFFDSDLMSKIFSSFGFSAAIITSLLAIYCSFKMIQNSFNQKNQILWYFYQFFQIIFITISCIFKYELCFLFALYLLTFLILLLNKNYEINDKLFAFFTTLLFFVISFVFLFVLDSKTQVMRISFDLPSPSDLFAAIIQNDKNGLTFISFVSAIPCFIFSSNKLNKADYFILFTSTITFLLSFIFAPLSDSPDILIRAIVVRLIFLMFCGQILSKSAPFGIIFSFVIVVYSITSHFVSLPHLSVFQRFYM